MNGRDFVKGRVAVAVGAAFAVAYAVAGTVTFTEETGVFRNPGQGWSTMGGKGSFDQTDPVVNIGSVYCRYTWAQLEPEEGRYDWKRLEDQLDFAASKGLPASFRVMCASRHDGTGWPTPEWVFNKGAKDDPLVTPKIVRGKATNIVHHTPIFDDPVFMAAHRRFIQALAAKYDGDPRRVTARSRSTAAGLPYSFAKARPGDMTKQHHRE